MVLNDPMETVDFIRLPTIKRYMQQVWKMKDTEKRITSDALALISEYLRLFALEAFIRAQDEAQVDDDVEIEPKHIEQILTQLLLDL